MVDSEVAATAVDDAVTGTIISKRKQGGGLIFLMVRPFHVGDACGDVQLMFPPEVWQTRTAKLALLRPGSVARFVTSYCTSGSFVDRIATAVILLRVKAEPTAVERVVEMACTGATLSCEEASEALGCNSEELQELMELWILREKNITRKKDDVQRGQHDGQDEEQQEQGERQGHGGSSRNSSNSSSSSTLATTAWCRNSFGLWESQVRMLFF